MVNDPELAPDTYRLCVCVVARGMGSHSSQLMTLSGSLELRPGRQLAEDLPSRVSCGSLADPSSTVSGFLSPVAAELLDTRQINEQFGRFEVVGITHTVRTLRFEAGDGATTTQHLLRQEFRSGAVLAFGRLFCHLCVV